MKKIQLITSLGLFIAGIVLLANGGSQVTGAATGIVGDPSSLKMTLGITLVVFAQLLLVLNTKQ